VAVAKAWCLEHLQSKSSRPSSSSGFAKCPTPHGPVNALAFTLPRSSPSYTGNLSPAQYQHIFQNASGRYGTTLDYAQETFHSLKQHGIHDKALEALLQYAKD
jgi:cation transport protein ChaC